MIVRESCVFYRDSRCLLEDRICDLSCNQMNLYEMDDNGNMTEEKEEAWVRKGDPVCFERLRIFTEDVEDDR